MDSQDSIKMLAIILPSMAPDMTRLISILAQLYCAPCGFLIRKKLFNSKMNCTFDAGSVENFGMADKVEKGDFFCGCSDFYPTFFAY